MKRSPHRPIFDSDIMKGHVSTGAQAPGIFDQTASASTVTAVASVPAPVIVGAPPTVTITASVPAPTVYNEPQLMGWGAWQGSDQIPFEDSLLYGRVPEEDDICIVFLSLTNFDNIVPTADDNSWTLAASDDSATTDGCALWAKIMDGTETEFASTISRSGHRWTWVTWSASLGSGWEGATCSKSNTTSQSSKTPPSLTASGAGSLYVQIFNDNNITLTSLTISGGWTDVASAKYSIAGSPSGSMVVGIATAFGGPGTSPSFTWTADVNMFMSTGGIVITPP